MERKVTRRYRRVSRAPIFLLLALILILIGMIALLFSMFVIEDLQTPRLNQVHLPGERTELYEGQVMAGDIAASAAIARYEQLAANSREETPVETERVLVQTLVPQTASVEDSYFDDAIFIGDSISLGMRLNIANITSGLTPNHFVAEKSVNLLDVINGKEVYTGKTQSMLGAIQAQVPNPRKIYILLGTNGLPWYSNEEQIGFYRTLVEQLREKYPDALLYAESLTPKQQVSDYDKRFDSAKIDDFNVRLQALAEEMGIYYLDVQSALRDENGYLKAGYAAPDGLHMISAGHKAMYQYYKTHAVQTDGYAEIVKK